MKENNEELFMSTLLKKRVKKRRYFFFVSSLLIFFVTLFSLYFITPLSSVKEVKLRGSHGLSSGYISSLVLPRGRVFLPTFSPKRSVTLLNASEFVEGAKVRVTPFSIQVDFTDILPVFHYKDHDYLSTGVRSPLLPSEIFGLKPEIYLEALPTFFVGAGIQDDSIAKNYFPAFKKVDTKSLLELDYVVLNSKETYLIYFKDVVDDFYHKIKLASTHLVSFIRSKNFKSIRDYYHQQKPSFQLCLESDKIGDIDVSVSSWTLNAMNQLEQKICKSTFQY